MLGVKAHRTPTPLHSSAGRACRFQRRVPGPVICAARTEQRSDVSPTSLGAKIAASLTAVVLASGVALTPASEATDAVAVGSCLLRSCQVQLAQCLGDPGCLQNLICLQGCNNRPDETACQIRCGDLYEDKAVTTFNCCAVSDEKCVPQAVTEDAYPVPSTTVLDDTFDASWFTDRWYITAGYNKLFDTFDCQEHFFSSPEPGKLFGRINWRINKPDGDFISRSTLQKFVADPEHPSILYNKGNEYLHYEDTWYVVSAKPDEYAFIYYKGNNDAWRGYGGATVYTRASKLPEEYIPEMARAAEAVGLKWEDFTITDNTCKPPPTRLGFANRVANEFEKDLKSFGRGFTVIESELVNELTKEEQLLQRELKEAGKALLELEKSYQPKKLFGFLSSLLPGNN